MVFKKWEEAIANPDQVTVLDLTGSHLKNLELDILMLDNLETLILDDNTELEHIPPELEYLPNLKELSLKNCNYKLLPQLNVLLNLEILDCSGMDLKLEYLEPSRILCLGQYKKLKQLTMNYCQLAEIPASLSSLTQLKVLSVEGNRLVTIPEDLKKLFQLELYGQKNNPATKKKVNVKSLAHEVILELNRLGLELHKSKGTSTLLIPLENEVESEMIIEIPQAICELMYDFSWNDGVLSKKEEFIEDTISQAQQCVCISPDFKTESIVFNALPYLCIGVEGDNDSILLLGLQEDDCDNPSVYSWNYEDSELADRGKLDAFLGFFEKYNQ